VLNITSRRIILQFKQGSENYGDFFDLIPHSIKSIRHQIPAYKVEKYQLYVVAYKNTFHFSLHTE